LLTLNGFVNNDRFPEFTSQPLPPVLSLVLVPVIGFFVAPFSSFLFILTWASLPAFCGRRLFRVSETFPPPRCHPASFLACPSNVSVFCRLCPVSCVLLSSAVFLPWVTFLEKEAFLISFFICLCTSCDHVEDQVPRSLFICNLRPILASPPPPPHTRESFPPEPEFSTPPRFLHLLLSVFPLGPLLAPPPRQTPHAPTPPLQSLSQHGLRSFFRSAAHASLDP